MNKLTYYLMFSGCLMMFSSCQKNNSTSIKKENVEVSQRVLSAISKLGFSTDEVIARDGGYLVEGDIFLTEDNLKEQSHDANLRIAGVEQYRTTNVLKVPRTITVSLDNLPAAYSWATDIALNRFNELKLNLKFQRVDKDGEIKVVGFNEGPSLGYIVLGSSGFPTSAGDPYNEVKMNMNEKAYGTNPNVFYVASVIAHEIGHCIGFRHTDYMNRAYSCNGRKTNEGASDIGAVHINGTPSGPDSDSWMLACANGKNRAFNENDIKALNFLYGSKYKVLNSLVW
ncbi:MAG: protease [Pedobacter sp.]|nr:MAG: protease [Pedobacter sp.]